jgi:hypothetical protein
LIIELAETGESRSIQASTLSDSEYEQTSEWLAYDKCVLGRKLREKSLEELKGLAQRSPERVPEVIHELSFRKTRGAKRFLDELNASQPSGQSSKVRKTGAGKSSEEGEHSGSRQSLSSRRAPEVAGEPNSACSEGGLRARDLEQRFELLRSTFTIEGEILARWGMTSSMPPEIEAQVLSSWRKSLEQGSVDSLGRSIVSLEEDLKRLAEERAAE